MRKRIVAPLMLLMVFSLLLVSVPPPTTAQFILSYTLPSDDGNGIYYITAYVDGVANGTVWKNPISYPNDTVDSPKQIEAGVNLTLAVFVWLNGTLAGISSSEEGYNVVRHSVLVSTAGNSSVFSQQNFTLVADVGEAYAPMYFYRYDVILDFDFLSGVIYRVVVNYEVFY